MNSSRLMFAPKPLMNTGNLNFKPNGSESNMEVGDINPLNNTENSFNTH